MSRSTIAASLLLMAFTGPATAATTPAAPRDTVQSAVNRVSGILREGEATGRTVDRRAEIRRIAYGLFDFDEASRRALGRHWQDRTPAERVEFVRLFTALLERTYIDKIETYLQGKMSFVSETVDGRHATVRSRIVSPQRPQTTVDYQAHLRDGQWKVYDLVIDGVSFVSNYRSQFDRTIKNGSYATLVTLLQRSVATVSASPRPATRGK